MPLSHGRELSIIPSQLGGLCLTIYSDERDGFEGVSQISHSALHLPSRTAVFLVKATLPYQLLWLQQLFDEFATLIFYLVRAAHFHLHSSSNTPQHHSARPSLCTPHLSCLLSSLPQVTGYKFRPADENPYLMVRGDDLTDDLEEFGLSDDGDVELHTPGTHAGMDCP